MAKIINIFNTFSTFGKVLIIVLLILILLLIIFTLIYAFKSNSDKQIDSAIEFLEEVRKESDNNIEGVAKEEIKVEKIEPKEKEVTVSTNENKIDIKSITDEMSKDIEKNNIELTEFEMEQEEKAIISYDELIKKVKEDEKNNVGVQEVDLDDRGYNLEDEFTYNTEVLDFDDILDNKEEITASTNLEPIGMVDEQTKANDLIEQTQIKSILDLDEIDEPLYTGSEFLSALKELRDSLE